MGRTNAAAVMAALLAGILITLALAADSSASGPSERPLGEAGSDDLQAGYTLRGQAWATELFGRRYGRYLLAAVTPPPGEGESSA